jgi:hypothetical protein
MRREWRLIPFLSRNGPNLANSVFLNCQLRDVPLSEKGLVSIVGKNSAFDTTPKEVDTLRKG